MSDKCGSSGPPTGGCPANSRASTCSAPKAEEVKCDVPPTLTFTCPGSDSAPAAKVDECAPPNPAANSCGAPTVTAAKKTDGGFCASVDRGNSNDNNCEARPLTMERADGSKGCGPKC